MSADSSAENTPNAQFVFPSPKLLDFNEKRLHWAFVVHAPDDIPDGTTPNEKFQFLDSSHKRQSKFCKMKKSFEQKIIKVLGENNESLKDPDCHHYE